MSAVAGITALIGAVKGLVDVGKNIINVTSQFEQTQKSLETVLQSAEKGQALFEELRQFSFETTFGVDELASASSQLLNVGVSTKVLQKDLKMLGDLAQGDKNKFQELTSIFAKVQSTGKVTSMQLQQLALRGVPILQTLKDMGVEGSASAEDLSRAFQKLTGEGGQFHNAMNNIIDTIEGKRGFITDTWKEILVNFGELSGLTEAYKDFLDTLYNILNKLNNKLREWNENPVIKALIRGTIKTALVAIVGIIVGSLIPALTTVVGLLGAINPTVWIGAGIGLITGAIGSFISENKRLEESLSGVSKVMSDAKQVIDDLGLGDIDEKQAKKNVKKGTASQEEKVVVALAKYTQAQADLLRMQKELDQTDTSLWSKQDLEDAKKMVAEQEKMVNVYKSLLSFEKQALYEEQHRNDAVKMSREYYEQMEEDFNKWADSLGQVQSGNEELNKLLAEQAEVESQINELVTNYSKEWRGITADGKQKILSLSDEQKKAFESDLKALKEKNKTLELEIKIANLSDWEQSLMKVFGFDKETVGNLVKSGDKWVEQYIKQINETYLQRKNTDELMGLNQSAYGKGSYAKEMAENILKVYNSLMSDPTKFGINEKGVLDNTTKTLKAELEKLHDMYVITAEDEQEWQIMLGNATEAVENFGNATGEATRTLAETLTDYAKGSISGTDAGTFITAMETYEDPLVAFLEVLITDLIDIIGGNERVKYLLDIIKNHLEALSPLIEAIINLLTIVEVIIRPLLKLLNDGLKALFGKFNKWFDDFYDSWKIEDEKKKEEEKDLTDQYKALLKAIKEQEEYYIRKKAELNMLAMDDRVTGVNDMILTPNGTFSTNPKDTIIATKNPQSLGSVTNNIKVINNAGAEVNVTEKKGNGINDIIVTISKKIASDVANGSNGWDSAFALQQQRIGGRRI